MVEYDIEELTRFAQNIRVLYVEDNDEERENTLEVFSIFFNNIHVASNGQEGLELFEKNRYDLIITGIGMPKMNGIDMITEIRKISKHINILIISSNTDKKYFIDLIKFGIDGYILKPISIDQFSSVLQRTLEKLKNRHELFEYRTKLEKLVQEEVEKRMEAEKVLAQQSKLAAMGEMMDAVAHQWKQPITNMSMYVDFLQYQFEDRTLDLEQIKEFQSKFNIQKEHILDTLHEFRTFLRPNKHSEVFHISHCVKSVLFLTKDEFIKNKINTKLDITKDFKIEAIENEFKHVLINIFNNAKDAFEENAIEKRSIEVLAFSKDDKNYITIKDNAGGIPKDIIDDIFKANVTSKEEGKGTGIGLYMSKQIVNKSGGEISVKNKDNGAEFTIELNLVV